MEKNTEKVLRDALEEEKEQINKLNERIKKQKKIDYISYVSISAVLVGLIGGVSAMIGIVTSSFTDIKGTNTDFSFLVSKSYTNNSLSNVASSLNQTQNDVNNLKGYYQYLVDNLKTSTGSAELKSLEARVKQLETKDDNLSQTILEDPDKALTAHYLRDKQKSVETELNDIKAAQIHLNDRIDAIYTDGVITIIVTLILGLLGFLYKNIFAKDHPKNNYS